MIEASINGGDWVKVGQVDSFSTKFKVADLKTGARHMFRVSAVNAKGQGKGLDSEIVTPTKPAGKIFIYFDNSVSLV